MEVERIVLHLDVDAFFCQVEQLRDPSLRGFPVACQQHQDIISVAHSAREAGVKKHMNPSEARRLLHKIGGRLVHVHTEAGGRISYKPYRQASTALMQKLKALPWASVVEKASIDEAYILVDPQQAGSNGAAAAPVGPAQLGGSSASSAADVGRWCAEAARSKVLAELGLTVSVGVAPNKLLAKLASAASKPDGVLVVLGSREATQQLLERTAARKLPGMGGKVAEAFAQSAIRSIADLQRYSSTQLQQLRGVKPSTAQQLHDWCRGIDPAPVQECPPPKTLSVQMSLTPVPLAMHPSQGMLEPMVLGAPDFHGRLQGLIREMGRDLVERVEHDREEYHRWPLTMAVQARAMGAGRDSSFAAKSCAFSLQSLSRDTASSRVAGAGGSGGGGALVEAAVQNFGRLAEQALQGYPPQSKLVELRLVACNFVRGQVAASAPITTFFARAPPRRPASSANAEPAALQESTAGGQPATVEVAAGMVTGPSAMASPCAATLAKSRSRESNPAVHASIAATEDEGAGGELAASMPPAVGAVQGPGVAVQPSAGGTGAGQQAAQDSQGGEAAGGEGSGTCVDLGRIDVGEQQRILDAIQSGSPSLQPSTGSGRKRKPGSEAGPGGLHGTKCRSKKAACGGDGSTQRTMWSFLQPKQEGQG